MIEMSGERRAGRSMLAVSHDDVDDFGIILQPFFQRDILNKYQLCDYLFAKYGNLFAKCGILGHKISWLS